MMKRYSFMVFLVAAALSGCSTSLPPVFFTLDDGAPVTRIQGTSPSVAITQVSLPDLIDRPQMVVRTSTNRVLVSEQQRWAEPLRRAIPRVLADDLGRLLNSSRVISIPVDFQRYDADYRVSLDVLRLDATEKQGADIDILWRIEARQGRTIVGRSNLHEPADHDRHLDLVQAQRRGLARVAAEIAGQIVNQPLGMAR